jgi:hypothetical protein
MKSKLFFALPLLFASMEFNAQNALNPYPSNPSETERNVFLGFAGYRNATGLENTFIGYNAGSQNVSGSLNTAVGTRSGSYNNGDGNVFLGSSTGHYTIGNTNVMIGNHAGFQYHGNNNILVGNSAAGGYPGTYLTGNDNIIIGVNASQTANDISNGIAIGRNAKIEKSNTFILGGTGEDAVNVGIGTSDPSAKLHTIGTVRHEGIEIGEGSQLVIDAEGNLKKLNVNYKDEIDALKAQVEIMKEMVMTMSEKLQNNQFPAPTNSLDAYPNPTTGSFTIKFTPENTNRIAVKIFDVNGKIILDKVLSNTNSEVSELINIESLVNGVYFVSVTDGQKVSTTTIVEN